MSSSNRDSPSNSGGEESSEQRERAAKKYLEEVRKDVSVASATTTTKTKQKSSHAMDSGGEQGTTTSGEGAGMTKTSEFTAGDRPFFRKLELTGEAKEGAEAESSVEDTGRKSSVREKFTARTFGGDRRLQELMGTKDEGSHEESQQDEETEKQHHRKEGETKESERKGQEDQGEGQEAQEDQGDTFMTEAKIGGNCRDEFDIKEGGFQHIAAGVDEESQATLLLKKQQDLRIVDDALEYMKEEYRQRMEEVKDKEEKLLKDKKEMEAMVERFRDFIADNDAKRNRAELKAQSESDARKKLEMEAYELQQQLSQLEQEQESLEAQLARLKRYSNYLEKCLAHSKEDFQEPAGLLMRHSTLERTNESLNQQSKEMQESAEERRQMVANLETETQNRVLALSSEYQDMQKKHEQLILQRNELEAQSESQENQDRRYTADSGEVSRAIHNMYGRCLSTASKKALLRVNADPNEEPIQYLLECMDVIDWRLTDLMQINKDYPAWKASKQREESEKGRAAGKEKVNRSHSATGGRSSSMVKHGRRAGTTKTGKKTHFDLGSEAGSQISGHESTESSVDLNNLGTTRNVGTGEVSSRRTAPNVYMVRLSSQTGDKTRAGLNSSLSNSVSQDYGFQSSVTDL